MITPPREGRRLIQSIDLAGLIGRHLPLTKEGRYWWCLCPFHEDHSPSFAVNPDQQLFYCFGCGKGGDAASFLMLLQGLTFPEVLEVLEGCPRIPSRGNGKPSEAIGPQLDVLKALDAATRFYHAMLRKGGNGSAFLRSRGIPDRLVSQFRIGYAPRSWAAATGFLRRKGFSLEVATATGLTVARRRGGGGFDRFRDRVMFPITGSAGKTVGFGGRSRNPEERATYINSPDGPLFHKGKVLYGLLQARGWIEQSGRAVLVEGFFDVLAMHMAGVRNTLGCMGSRVTADHAALLRRLGVRKVTLLFDGDPEGRAGAERANRVLTSQGLQADIATLPGGEDPDSFLRATGPDALRIILRRAAPSR